MSGLRIPDRWKRRSSRPDHSRFYMCIMWSLFIGTIVILLRGPAHPSILDATMSDQLQRLYAGVLSLGTGCCVAGFMCGTRFFRPHVDLRYSYRLTIVATPANVATLSLYLIAICHGVQWHPVLAVQNGVMIFAIIVAHCWMAWDLFWEIRRIDERVSSAITRAVALAVGEVNDDGCV